MTKQLQYWKKLYCYEENTLLKLTFVRLSGMCRLLEALISL